MSMMSESDRIFSKTGKTAMNKKIRMQIEPEHPGKILLRGIKDHHLTPYRAAKAAGVSQSTMTAIVNCRRGISPETALRLSLYFGTSAEYWLNLQSFYDLRMTEKKMPRIKEEVLPLAKVA